MANYDSNYAIAQEISARIGVSPIPFDSVYSIALEIYNELGGEPAEFDSVYSILLGILPLVEGGVADKVIDDSVITTVKTWSSSKINSELSAKQDTLTAGSNISISSNTISADGYVWNASTGGFAEKYKQDSADGGQIVGNTATGLGSHAEGYHNEASGDYGSHAEGCETVANGAASHAEGLATEASGQSSHAEGQYTKATNYYAHAEGNKTNASGHGSHAEGFETTAQNQYEHAEGTSNYSHKANNTYGNAGNTQHSVGIGGGFETEADTRKNAFEIMQNGDTYLFGIGGYQGTDTKVQDATVKTLQTVISDINTAVAGKQDALTAGAGIEISGTTISATYEVATTADIEALFVLPSFYVDNALFETYNLTWGQWLDSRYNTSGFTHIYTASTYDSSVEQIPEVVSSAYPTAGGHYYSTCTDTYVPQTGPANDEIWYTTESGNLWEPMLSAGGEPESSLQRTDGGALLSNRYVNGHGVLKFTNNITILKDYFGWNDDGNSDLTTITLPNSITSVGWILGQENEYCPNLESVYYNGTVAECSDVSWSTFANDFGWDEIICLDGTYTISGGGSGSGSGGSGSGSGGSGSGNG